MSATRERQEREPDNAAGSIPEIGPLLGGMVTPAPEHVTGVPGLDEVRLELVSTMLGHAGAARERLARGDVAGSAGALEGAVWLEAWRTAAAAAAERVLDELVARVNDAALVSRMPARRLARERPTDEDRRVLRARLDATGTGLEAATAALRGATLRVEHLRRVAGELELAWAALCRVVRVELDTWDARVARVRGWRRPWTAFAVGSALALGLATWLGLVLGGFLPVPSWLRPFAEWAWNTGWL
jgi:hypothetical protein